MGRDSSWTTTDIVNIAMNTATMVADRPEIFERCRNLFTHWSQIY